MESAITVKGQATIPKPIREHLGLQPGDRVKFFVHPDGSVVLLPKISASAVRGIVKSRSVDEENSAFANLTWNCGAYCCTCGNVSLKTAIV